MMGVDFYNLFLMIKKMFKDIKFIIVGDYAQLPPVKDSWSGDYKNSPATYELCDGNRIQLTKCMRADNTLFDLCKNVNKIDIDNFQPKVKTYLNIAYTHKTRININNECMNRYLKEYDNKEHIFIERDNNNMKTQDVKLCKGMPIIAWNNIYKNKHNIINTDKFTIKQINNEYMIITDGHRDIKLPSNIFHTIFYIGFCITIYACQGETFNKPYTIYDWNHKIFCDKAKYVSMSRATNIDNIQISN